MKITRFFALFLICVLIFCGCAADDTQLPVTTTQNNKEFTFGVKSNADNADVKTPQKESPADKEDVIISNQAPSMGFCTFLSMDDKDTFAPLIYNGGDFEFFYEASSGVTAMDLDLGFMIDGIYQPFKVEDNGKTSDYNIKHLVTVPAGATKIYKIMLRPNIGKKGDVRMFCNASIMNPNDRVDDIEKGYSLMQLSLVNDMPSKFTMNADSDMTASVCNSFSGMEIVPCDKKIKNMFNDIDATGSVCHLLIYHDLDTEVYYDSYKTLLATDHIEASRSSEFPVTLVLGGGQWGTTQRVSVYVNSEIMPVFDGKYYADVPIEKNKQTNLNIKLDTTGLDEWSNIYFLAYTLSDAEYTQPNAFVQSRIYSVRIS